MRISELQTRWSRQEVQGWTVVSDANSGKLMEHSAPTGDFLFAYFKHVTMPWYRRWYMPLGEWEYVEQKMRRILNDNNNVTWLDQP